MPYDLVIRNGLLITANTTYRADLAISGERIAAIGEGLSGLRTLDATGLYVLPGAIDGHVHLTDPTTFAPYIPTADSFASGSVAAALGGTTTLIDFSQPDPGQSLVESLAHRRADADGQTVIDYGLHLNLREVSPATLAEVPAIFKYGVPSVKLFMAYEGYRLSDGDLLQAMQAVAADNGLAIVHAENDDVIRHLQSRAAATGQSGPRWYEATCPAITEGEAVHRALALARLAGVRCLIFHVSCTEAVRAINLARRRGQPAYGEACVQYLVLTSKLYERDDFHAQSLMVRPPLRDVDHQTALWQGLVDDTLNIISTDHNPRPRQADYHPAGTAGIETRLALVHHFGVTHGPLTLNRWVDVCCTRPAQLFGLHQKGQLQPGFDADIVLFDPAKSITFSPQTLHSNIDFCTYQDTSVTGYPVTTLSRGTVIVEDGRFVGSPGHGRFLERAYR
jgi:dihydropyrimidinase